MLHLVPLVAYVAVSVATIRPAGNATDNGLHARRSYSSAVTASPVKASLMDDVLSKLHIPFIGRKSRNAKPKPPQPMMLVDRRLRDLVVQQEKWFAQEGRYGRNAYRAGQLNKGDSTAFEDVQVEIVFAGRNGWSALASHPAASGQTCVIFVGVRELLPIVPRTHHEAKEAAVEGVPTCDRRP